MAAKEGGVSEERIFAAWKRMIKDEEFWAIVEEFPKYIVSNRAKVMNYETGNIISDGSKAKGKYKKEYKIVDLRKRKFRLHILVAKNFVPNPGNLPFVNHINGEKYDCDAINLEWVTYAGNTKKWWELEKKKYKIEQWNCNGELLRIWDSFEEIEKALGYKRRYMRRFCEGKYKGFIWKYRGKKKRKMGKKIDEEDFKNNYVSLGIIKGWDCSNYYIHKTEKKVASIWRNNIKIYKNGQGYDIVTVFDTNRKRRSLKLHKIVNQVLKGGKYEDVMDHIDGVRNNNEKENLEAVTIKENITRACGKAVKQIDPKTGNVMGIFGSIRDAVRNIDANINSRKQIPLVCDGKQKHAFGYKWEWVK
jgi:hypothetical protein